MDPDDEAGPDQRVWVREANGRRYYRLRLPHGAGTHYEFVLDQDGRHVWPTSAETVPFADVVSSLLGPVLGCVLRLRGLTCLHASVVGIDGRAIAILGRKGFGKSTTAAALARHGQAVLADDIAVVVETGSAFVAQPGYARLRLWPSALQAVYGEPDGLPRVVSFKDKRYLELTARPDAGRWRFEPNPLPLGAVYLLRARSRKTPALAIGPLSPAEGLMTLVAHSYVDYMVSPALRAREFARLGRLTEQVPLRQVERPAALATLSELGAMLCDDFRALD